jgi:uncharacterized membrane protein YoaK (UPF0700 family)
LGELVVSKRRGSASWLSPVGWGLVAELIALGSLLGCWRLAGPSPALGTTAVLVAIAAIAMGVQSAVVLRLHVGPTTTYVTGTLTSFAIKMVRGLYIEKAPAATTNAQDANSAILWSSKGPVIYGVDWLVYAGGACVSALLFLRVREVALVLPMAAIVAAIIGIKKVECSKLARSSRCST